MGTWELILAPKAITIDWLCFHPTLLVGQTIWHPKCYPQNQPFGNPGLGRLKQRK